MATFVTADMEFYESESEGFEELLSPVTDLKAAQVVDMDVKITGSK
jgi:hypothetical protein